MKKCVDARNRQYGQHLNQPKFKQMKVKSGTLYGK
jgi:hypothetical protein